MKKFLVLYMMSIDVMHEMMKNSTPEEQKKDMDGWKEWLAKHKASFADVGGPVGKNSRVTREDANESSNDVMGYSVIQAESKEAVFAILKETNHLDIPGAYMEVMEVKSM